MSNFLHDNPDLCFYLDKWIQWEEMFDLVEINPDAEDGFSDANEAREFYREVLEQVGAFSATEVAPYAAHLDQCEPVLVNGEVQAPEKMNQIIDELTEMGLNGLCLPRELGGLNCPSLIYFIVAELMGRADVSVMTNYGFHAGIAASLMLYSIEEGSTEFDPETGTMLSSRFGEQIGRIIEGKAWGSMDITEPDAGSDMAALRTKGFLEDGQWLVSGTKLFISSGHGQYHLVIARTEKTEDDGDPMAGLAGLSLFLVEAYTEDDAGNRTRLATVERIEDKLGHHASATVMVRFDRTPALLIGERGQGFQLMLRLMNNARVAVGFEGLGICEASHRLAKKYASERMSMGKTIDQHELIADILDGMETDICAIRALGMKAAWHTEFAARLQLKARYLVEEGTEEHAQTLRAASQERRRARRVTPLLKYIASERAVEMARECVQVHGGFGYTREFGAEKLLRDALVLPIYEGTSQIQALMATKDTLLAITRDPSRFMRRLGDAWRRSTLGFGGLEKRVAGLQYRVLKAQKALVMRLARAKMATRKDADLTLREAFASWDPKQDFGPALLHAENLTRMLADVAMAEALLEQVRVHPERQGLLLRHVERAEPRSHDFLYRIQYTGDRLLRALRGLPQLEEEEDDLSEQGAA
jgi:alkylation response protein AidB-like acyl-CoA dehydrogenase